MLYILFGEDDYSLHQALEGLKASLGDPSLVVANTTVFDGRELTLDALKTACETVPFLAPKRLVIVEGLLQHFEVKDRPRKAKKPATKSNTAEAYKSFGDYLPHLPESTVVVLVDGGLKAENPLLKELASKAEVKAFPRLKDAVLKQRIQLMVKEQGGAIAPAAVNLLARLVGGNLWLMSTEVAKLVAYAAGRGIGEEDVQNQVSHAEPASIFAVVDAILEQRAGRGEEMLQDLLDRGAVPTYILTMLVRQLGLLVRLKELQKQKLPGAEMQRRLGLSSDFVFRKTLDLADRYSWERLKETYRKLLATDLAIKRGIYDGELALNLLIAELCV
ncbi:MAG: DNA polymerase III subunit delta [Chloroflexota bacterium]